VSENAKRAHSPQPAAWRLKLPAAGRDCTRYVFSIIVCLRILKRIFFLTIIVVYDKSIQVLQ